MSEDAKKNEDLFSTWRRAAFDPRSLYTGDTPARGRTHPLVFAMIVGAVAPVANALAGGGFGGAVAVGMFAPLGIVVSVYFSAALVHFWLMALPGPAGRFRDTAGVIGYAHAPLILGVVPLVGAVVGAVWYVVVLAVGLRQAQRTPAWKAWLATLLGAGTPVLLALFLRAGVVEAYKIPSGGMSASMMIGDHVFVEKVSYGPLIPGTDVRLYSRLPPRRGEVIVFKFPENKQQDFVFRTIALPGDTFEAINGRPVINGWLVPHCRVGAFRYENRTAELFVEFLGDRDYLTLFDTDPDEKPCSGADTCEQGACRGGICGTLQGPFRVVADEVWVMGDNRNNSHDSRSWRRGLGAGVPFENIKGRATFVWMSFGPAGAIMQDRIGVSMNGRPVLPAANTKLAPALDRCLSGRPPLAETTPPPGRR